MPSPVSFNISLAPMPVNYRGTMQQWAQLLADRLTVTPAEPWSSFQNGSVIPASNLGPVLYQEKEWRVWNSSTGAYTYHTQNGAGLVDATVTRAKLANGTPGSVLIYDAAGRPIELTPASGTSGQVITLVGGTTPAYADTFVPSLQYFETTFAPATPQLIDTSGAEQTVRFDTVRFQNGVAFNAASRRLDVPANEVWLLYASVNITDAGAASTNVNVQLTIRRDGVSTQGIGRYEAVGSIPAGGMDVSVIGIMKNTGSYFDVGIVVNETTPAVGGVQISANITNTRFGGHRIL